MLVFSRVSAVSFLSGPVDKQWAKDMRATFISTELYVI